MKNSYFPSGGWFKRLAAFFVAVGATLFFMFRLAPCLERIPFVKSATSFIEESGIDAGALYYTEIEEFSEAEVFTRNAIKY